MLLNSCLKIYGYVFKTWSDFYEIFYANSQNPAGWLFYLNKSLSESALQYVWVSFSSYSHCMCWHFMAEMRSVQIEEEKNLRN